MDTTGKQDRNGVPGPAAAGGYVATPGPDSTGQVAAAKASAEAAGLARVQPPAGDGAPPAGTY